MRPENRNIAAENCKLPRDAGSRDSCHHQLTLLLLYSGPATCRTSSPSSLSVRVTPGRRNESINRTTPDKTLPLSLSYTVSLSPSSSLNPFSVKGHKTCRWQNAQTLSRERSEKSIKSHYTLHTRKTTQKEAVLLTFSAATGTHNRSTFCNTFAGLSSPTRATTELHFVCNRSSAKSAI